MEEETSRFGGKGWDIRDLESSGLIPYVCLGLSFPVQ